jgi:hypothetical protein
MRNGKTSSINIKMSKRTGYHKLSHFMVDEKYTIFRKFKVSANRDLLYLQAEIAKLEDEFAQLQDRDRNTYGEPKLYDRNWYLLSTAENRGQNSEQWHKILQIRSKLREYCADHIVTGMLLVLTLDQTSVFRDMQQFRMIYLSPGSVMLQCSGNGF